MIVHFGDSRIAIKNNEFTALTHFERDDREGAYCLKSMLYNTHGKLYTYSAVIAMFEYKWVKWISIFGFQIKNRRVKIAKLTNDLEQYEEYKQYKEVVDSVNRQIEEQLEEKE